MISINLVKFLIFGSVISRKLCFSIFYYDIRCAILAKQELDLIGSELNKNIKIGLFGMVKISLIVLVLSYDNQGYLNSCYNKQPTNQPKRQYIPLFLLGTTCIFLLVGVIFFAVIFPDLDKLSTL